MDVSVEVCGRLWLQSWGYSIYRLWIALHLLFLCMFVGVGAGKNYHLITSRLCPVRWGSLLDIARNVSDAQRLVSNPTPLVPYKGICMLNKYSGFPLCGNKIPGLLLLNEGTLCFAGQSDFGLRSLQQCCWPCVFATSWEQGSEASCHGPGECHLQIWGGEPQAWDGHLESFHEEYLVGRFEQEVIAW